jgi:hypothetical protein
LPEFAYQPPLLKDAADNDVQRHKEIQSKNARGHQLGQSDIEQSDKFLEDRTSTSVNRERTEILETNIPASLLSAHQCFKFKPLKALHDLNR